MSYISAADSETSVSGPGCGPSCNCGPCKSGGVGEWYVREKPAGLSEGFGEPRTTRTSMSREAMRRFERERFQRYKKACAGIRVLQQLRRDMDPVEFWTKMVARLPALFRFIRQAKQDLQSGKLTRDKFDEAVKFQMKSFFPPGYALRSEAEELAKARCALAKARWQASAKRLRRRPTRQSLHGFEYGRFGYIGERVRALKSSPPYLVFHSIRHFKHNSSAINDRVRDQIRHLVKLVEMSWNTDQPIVEMRLVGHTDSTGSETYNVALGDTRAKALQKELLQIKGIGDRVLVVVGPSPGKTKPVGNNATAPGRSQNRRVDVFVTFGTRPVPPPPPPPPPPKPCIDPRKCVTEVPRGSVIITRPDQIGPTIPPPPKGKSIEQLINEKLARLPRWLSWAIRKAIIEGSCMALETALGKVVGELSESEKDELRRQCSERAKKPL